MLRKNIPALLIFIGFIGIAHAQVTTNSKVLEQTALGYQLRDHQNYLKALSLASQKNWPLHITNRTGNKAVLVGLDGFNLPLYYITNNNTIAAATTRANQLWPGGSSGLGLSGSSANMKNKLGIWDGGRPLETHVELTGRINWRDTNPDTPDDHPTHTSGTLIASGVNPNAKGMAFGIKGLVAYNFTGDIGEMAAESKNLLVSNHSYSIISGWSYNSSKSRWEFYGRPNENEDYKFGYYSPDAQSLDAIAYNAPYYLIVKSAGNNRTENGPAIGSSYYRYDSTQKMVDAGSRPAGISSNDGYDIIPWDCNAKNILTVGAIQGIPGGYNRVSDAVLGNFSSWGPTDDGRIKPDIVADGINVLSSVATSNTSYASFSGTSMSSPNAAGSLFLLQEYYSKLKNDTTAFMRSATLKGLAIHTADEAGPAPGPDYQYGWGVLNVEKAAAVITAAVPTTPANSNHLLYEKTLLNGASFSFPVIASGKGPLKATICWTDVKGDVDLVNVLNNNARKLVNDLDIRITKGGRIYMPWILDRVNPANPAARGDNVLDNAEKIDIDSTVPGQTYTVTVTHKGTLASGQQAYSLLVSGVGGTAYCASAPTSSAGARIDSVSFKGIHYANPPGPTTYTDNTNLSADIEPLQTVPIFVKVGSSDGTNATKIVKVFIDFNNNGVFDDSELVATSAPMTNGNFTANISTPAYITVGNTCLMRIVVSETAIASNVTACSSSAYTNGETQDYRLRVVSPSNDIAVSGVSTPTALDCAKDEQYLTIMLKNNGSIDQTNIPVTVTLQSGSTVTSLSGTYKGTVTALGTSSYTIQTPFVTAAGATYTITATASLPGDQNPSNNTLVTSIAIGAKNSGPAAVASICGNTVLLHVNNPGSRNYFWYESAVANAPFAGGINATSTNTGITPFYVASDAGAYIGPQDKMVYTSGGYNNFIGNYVKFNNTVPVIIESARLYTGYPGTIEFTVGNIITANPDGSFTYNILSTTTLNVTASNPNPTQVLSGGPGVPGNPANDTGAVYYLNLPVSQTGDHVLIIKCDPGGATIFRNNNITSAPYPFTIPGVMSITGNSAIDTTNPNLFQKYYYFFYHMRVRTANCPSDRTPVTPVTPPTPVASLVADSLTSSIATGNAWYQDSAGVILSTGATGQKFKPARSGNYKTIVTDTSGCQKTSNTISYVVTAIPEIMAREIRLMVSPNPSKGVFNLSFETAAKSDLKIDILNAAGQNMYNSFYPGFTGKFSRQVQLDATASGFYVLRIQHNKQTYLQKLIIEK
ncbi:MAG: hypothetical protein NVSMB63_11870 [Sediminibacterium sp.]